MMSGGRRSCFVHAASALALVLLVAGCTKGGQFDPTEMFNSDMFDTKKKLKGERAPVFPEGVPGATSGVPADLVKGYQPPAEPGNADVAVPGPTPPAAAAEATKPKPKPKPKIAAQKPPASSPTRINVGPGQGAPTQQAGAPAWPAPPPTSPQPQASQSVWPAPPQSTSSTQSAQQPAPSVWPDPPSGGGSSR